MNSELDRIFEQGLSEVTRSPKVPLSDEQIAAAAASTSGAGVWLLAHAQEILLCAVSLAVGVGGTLLVTHLIGNRNTVPTPTETAAAIATDTANTAHTAMVMEDAVAFTGEMTVNAVETHGRASLQNDRHTPSVTDPVVVKKTVVQRDTVVINETVTLKDTVYLMDN